MPPLYTDYLPKTKESSLEAYYKEYYLKNRDKINKAKRLKRRMARQHAEKT